MFFYEITPVDTLFFRGAEPMEAGQLSNNALFPPPATVITGAIRTSVLKQKGVDFTEYNSKQFNSPEIETLVGKSGEKAPFSVMAVFLKKNGDVYVPAPYSWYINVYKKPTSQNELIGKKIVSIFHLNADKKTKLGILSSAENLPLVKAENPIPLGGGFWVKLELLKKPDITIEKNNLLFSHELYSYEPRTGISLLDDDRRSTRNVKEGALFTAGHIRLLEGVSIIVGLNKDCGLQDRGMMHLGGEQRKSAYKKIEGVTIPVAGKRFMALSSILADKKALDACVCTGKLLTIAGWDLAKAFHKDTAKFFPAGSIFETNLENNLVPIAL